jgi:hypothetical protein
MTIYVKNALFKDDVSTANDIGVVWTEEMIRNGKQEFEGSRRDLFKILYK